MEGPCDARRRARRGPAEAREDAEASPNDVETEFTKVDFPHPDDFSLLDEKIFFDTKRPGWTSALQRGTQLILFFTLNFFV